jgi:hypothetical protein
MFRSLGGDADAANREGHGSEVRVRQVQIHAEIKGAGAVDRYLTGKQKVAAWGNDDLLTMLRPEAVNIHSALGHSDDPLRSLCRVSHAESDDMLSGGLLSDVLLRLFNE